jgi:hypothetical protein
VTAAEAESDQLDDDEVALRAHIAAVTKRAPRLTVDQSDAIRRVFRYGAPTDA